jgi:hypothetical protein
MQKTDKLVSITRGKPRHLQLSVSSGASSVHFRLQPVAEPIRPVTGPGTLLQFKPRTQEGDSVNRYRVDDDNRVRLIADNTEQDGTVFASAEDLEQVVAGWPMRRLTEIWNELPGVRPVARFEKRKVAVQRIWQALQSDSSSSPPQQPGSKRKRQARETKVQLVLRMLRAPEGTTLEALMKATRWQAHSVRGFLSGKVSKQLGLPVESFRRDGQRVYRLHATE